MHCCNILLSISDFLDFNSLIEFSQVSKQFRKVSKTSSLWQKHFFELFFGDYSFFGDIPMSPSPSSFFESADFYFLSQKRGNIKLQWMQMPSEVFEYNSLFSLITDLFSALKEPFMPLPQLRRDPFYFSTILQDLIGNQMDVELLDPPEAIQQLSENRDFYETIFADSNQLEEFTRKRWLLKILQKEVPSRYSLASQSTSAEGEKGNIVLHIMKLLKKTMKIQCEGVLVWVSKFTDPKSFVKIYSLLWEVYCSSIHYLESRFRAFCDIVNSSYDSRYQFEIRKPAYSIVRLMVIIWRRKVLSKTADRLISSVLELIANYRENLVRSLIEEPEDIDIIIRTVRGIIDLSVNELNIFMIEHSHFNTEGLYSKLSEKFILSTENFYDSIAKLQGIRLNQVLSIDLNLAKRVFLPCTLKRIEKKNVEIRIETIKNKFLSMFDDYKVCDSDPELQPLVDTAFGQMIFNYKPSIKSKSHIRRFLNFLVLTNEIEEVHDYNYLELRLEELKKDKAQEDYEIEFKNSQINVSIETCEEENILFSIANDIDYETFMVIRANKVSNN